MDDLPFIPVIYLHKMVVMMREEHIDTDTILRECGISPALLARPDTMLTARQAGTMMRKFVGLSQDVYPGVRFGKRLDLLTHGLLGYVFYWKGDFKELITNIVAFLRVRFPLMTFDVIHKPEYFSLRIGCDSRIREMEPFLTQAFIGSLYQLGSLVTQNIEISCRRDLFRDLKPLHTQLTPRIFHSDDCNEVRYYSAESPRIETAASPTTITAAVIQQESAMEEHGFIIKLRNLLFENIGNHTSAEDIASRLGMSVRTLRRRLSNAGMNFNKVRSDVRMQIALRYLTTTSVSIERIADIVGYSDQTTFTRAFREWKGHTPNEIRQKRLNSLAPSPQEG